MAKAKSPRDPFAPADPVLPEDIRRGDLPDAGDAVLPTADESRGIPGIAPSEDGGIEDHPMHDSDLEDADAEDFEELMDEAGEGGLESVDTPQR